MDHNINFPSNKCIHCESTSDLNTFVHLVLDGRKVVVGVCDNHLGISINKAKELIVEKTNKLFKLLDEMKGLGLDISSIGGSIAVVEGKGVKVEPEVEVEPEPEVVVKSSASKVNVKKVLNKNIRSITGEGASKFSSYDIDNMVGREAKEAGCTIPVVEEVELQVVNGKGGVPVQIPKKIKESTGVTNIRIVPTSNKMLSHVDKKAVDERSFAGSYHLKDCNLCGGTGDSRAKGHDKCPKCNGTGQVAI